jgi:hypothetical protein
MKDKAIIWITVLGVVLWILAAYPAARGALVHVTRAVVTEIKDKL